MAAGRSEETALGSAHGRFLESLPRKAIELRGTIALLSATPAAEGPRAELRRKLHALYASALVFRSDPLAALVQEGIQLLDAVTQAKRAVSSDELATLSSVVRRVAELRTAPAPAAAQPPPARSESSVARPESSVPPRPVSSAPPRVESSLPPRPESGAPPGFTSARPQSSVPPGVLGYNRSAEGSRRSATLTGLLPVGVPQPTPSAMPGRWISRPSLFASEQRAGAQTPVLQRVLHVLVVAADERVGELGQLLAADSLRVTALSAAREALENAREDAPDVVLAEAQQAFAGGLMEGLRADPLTDFVPVVVIAESDEGEARERALRNGADEVVTRPLRAEQLLRMLGRVTGTLVEIDALEPAPSEATIDEVCSRVSQEIRRGLVDATESGRELKVQLGEGAEVMAAAWAAVARVRALFTERSGGRVRFVDRPSSTVPALLSVGPASGAEGLEALAGQSPLSGRRILVADDDTAVVLFFAGLLRDEGASVTEVTDGAEALRAARRERPDLIISDVVMPGLSGFALCRELKRDPLLADVPVILISWKEDLLVRMRELSAGASGYLRKEASAVQILASVRDALRSRSQLEARLSAPGEVRGNLEGTGLVALLRSVRRARPDSRLTVRDAWNMFECELRDGRLSQLTRTAADGSFVRNEAALPQLLGVSTGRFSVTSAEGALKQAVEGTLDEALARGARELGAQLDALSGASLEAVERVVLDEDAQAALLDHAPPLVRDVVSRLTQGEAPRQIWQSGMVERALLESMLLDMAKRGAIRALVGSGGDDLIELARAERERQPQAQLGSLLPPAPAPVISMLASEAELAARDAAPPELQSAAEALAEGGLLELPTPMAAGPLLPPAPEPSTATDSLVAPLEALAAAAAAAPAAPVGVSAAPAAPVGVSAAEPGLPAAAADTVPIVTPAPRPRSDPRELDRAAADARSSRGTLWAWTAAFVALVAIGFLADRARNAPKSQNKLEAIGAAPATELHRPNPPAPRAAPEPAAPPAPAQGAESALAGAQARSARPAAVSAEEGGFQIYDHVLDEGVKVGPEQALLLVQGAAQGDGATLAIDGKPVGTLPAKAALSEGMHELAISRGDSVSYRFLAPRRGATWVLREP
jgi:CheY-like chemotaxis protein